MKMSISRISIGKSTTMNAMLRQRILSVGMGHTTNCFLQVGFSWWKIEGTDKAEPYVLAPESDQPKSVSVCQSIWEIAAIGSVFQSLESIGSAFPFSSTWNCRGYRQSISTIQTTNREKFLGMRRTKQSTRTWTTFNDRLSETKKSTYFRRSLSI